MKITLSTDAVTRAAADIVAVGVRAGRLSKDENVARLDKAMGGALTELAKDEDFKAESGEVLKVPGGGRVEASWVVLVGLGSGRAHVRDNAVVAVKAARAARNHKSLAIVPTSNDEDAVRAVAEGVVTGAYRYARYFTGKRKPRGGAKSATILVARKTKALDRAASEGVVVGEAVNLCRDLVNGPPNDLNPLALADAARAASRSAGVKCQVWNKSRIEKEKMQLLLAVNRGSGVEPRVIHMTWAPPRAKKKIVFVGKGLTFDSGGLCIKPAKSMIDMKCDMAGGATTIGIVIAAARLKLPIEVHGIVGSTENMTGQHAYRPGDVFSSRDGKSVEIINTDAEGRLVLADVLAYARELEPDYMIDHATLTGACMVALGKWTAGLFSNDDRLAKLYGQASDSMQESFWHMPLSEPLRETLKSDVADLKHTGDAHGGAITAALFLSEFVGKTKWAHCDIAGPAFLEQPHGLHPKGGTGFGVATGVSFLRALAAG
jgi:leucyl aminopeptidase